LVELNLVVVEELLTHYKLICKDEKNIVDLSCQDIVDPSGCHPKGGEEVAHLRLKLLVMPVDRRGVFQG